MVYISELVVNYISNYTIITVCLLCDWIWCSSLEKYSGIFYLGQVVFDFKETIPKQKLDEATQARYLYSWVRWLGFIPGPPLTRPVSLSKSLTFSMPRIKLREVLFPYAVFPQGDLLPKKRTLTEEHLDPSLVPIPCSFPWEKEWVIQLVRPTRSVICWTLCLVNQSNGPLHVGWAHFSFALWTTVSTSWHSNNYTGSSKPRDGCLHALPRSLLSRFSFFCL